MFRQTFWMRALGHPTPKRSIVLSNSTWISELSFASRMRAAKLKSELKTTDKYTSKAGVKRFKGNKNLKGTQLFALIMKCLFLYLLPKTQVWTP